MKYPQDRFDAYRFLDIKVSADEDEADALEAFKLDAIPTS
jgi:hypothetical protein